MTKMNQWLKYSIEYANQRAYLDDLFRVYPVIPNGIRDIDTHIWNEVEQSFHSHDNVRMLRALLRLELFPFKDSYVAYFKRDPGALLRNPATVNRLCWQIYEMGLDKVWANSTQPKETNRQMGPRFMEWVRKGCLGVHPLPLKDFVRTTDNAVLDAGDAAMKEFAKEELGYQRDKGLDFLARFNGKYVIGEAKFLTDMGGHQNAQFNDAMAIFEHDCPRATPIAILDGVVYIPGEHHMYASITEKHSDKYIMSALVLRDFLYQL